MTPLRRPALLARAALVGLLALGAAACGGDDGPAEADASANGPSGTARVTGTVAYRERLALSPTAEVRVELADVSRQDVPATTLVDVTIVAAGDQVPIPFELPYDPSTIDERGSYAIRATIVDGERTLFRTTEAVRVITQGGPTTDVAVVLTRASG